MFINSYQRPVGELDKRDRLLSYILPECTRSLYWEFNFASLRDMGLSCLMFEGLADLQPSR